MELGATHKWRMANGYIALFGVVCAGLHTIPGRPELELPLVVAGSIAAHQISQRFIGAIADYEPQTELEAKRANEQIRLTATFANLVAVASISVLVFSRLLMPNVSGTLISVPVVIIMAGFAHYVARKVVSLIKDESNLPITGA